MSTLKSLVLTLSALALTATLGCSNSSGGGGGSGGAKPNLTAATQVGQSFSVIQNAGRGQGQVLTLQDISASVESVPQDKVRTQKLQKLISSPNQCKVSFKDNTSNGGGPRDPSGDMTFGFTLLISGATCPLNANFSQLIRQSQSGAGQIQLDISFKVTDDQAKQLVTATDAQIRGKAAFGPSADGKSFTGKGQFLGYVNSLQYGRVNLEMNLKQDIHASPDGRSAAGTILEETAFKFPDPTNDVVLTKLTTVSGNTQTVTYTANGATITEQEYKDVLGGMGDGSGQSSNQTEQPSEPQQPSDPRERY